MLLKTVVLSDGKECRFTEPRLRYLIEMEQIVGSLLDADVLNRLPARQYLIFTCLREAHPEITPGLIGDWSFSDYALALNAALEVCPLWASAGSPSPGPSTPADSDAPSSSPPPPDSDGPPAPPEPSA